MEMETGAATGGGEASQSPAPEAEAAESAVEAMKKRFTLNFATKGWEAEAPALLRKYGVLIVRNVFAPEECTERMNEMIEQVKIVCPELEDEWNDFNAPPGPRSGLFQNVVGQIPVIWKVRTDERVRHVFETLYSGLRGKPVTDFVTSCDGFNLRPYGKPFRKVWSKDWAHLDQTTTPAYPSDPYACIQGQVVLSDSDACFRCSPLSIHKFEEISALTRENFVRISGRTGNELKPGDWNLLKPTQYETVKKLVEEVGGAWQIPICEPRGSMIFWMSSTVHSARIQAERPVPAPVPLNPWHGWRGVVYVCYRPQQEVGPQHFERLQWCVPNNRCTNHWGKKMFGTSYFRKKFNPNVTALLKRPLTVYKKHPELKPEWTPALRALCFPSPSLSPSPPLSTQKPVKKKQDFFTVQSTKTARGSFLLPPQQIDVEGSAHSDEGSMTSTIADGVGEAKASSSSPVLEGDGTVAGERGTEE